MRNARCPRTASSWETTSSSEPVTSAAKITWTTCLRYESDGRRDRVDDRDGSLERDLLAAREEPGLLEELPMQRRDEALPDANASPGQEPHLARRLLVAQKENAPLPAQDRRDPDPRLHQRLSSSMTRTLEYPRSLPASSSTSTSRTDATGATTSCAIRIPASTENGSRPVFRSTTRISPRYPESMSPGELTIPIPWRAASPERGWTKPA